MDIRSTITCAPPVPSPAPKFHPQPQQFNPASHKHERATFSFVPLQAASKRLNAVWGMTSALAQFVIMGMFVQGFWFSSKLVRIVSQLPAQPPTNHPNKMLWQERNCSILNEGKTYSRHSAYNEPYTSEANDSYQRWRQDVGKKIGGLDK